MQVAAAAVLSSSVFHHSVVPFTDSCTQVVAETKSKGAQQNQCLKREHLKTILIANI
jgi:hypothetical protein